MFKTLLKVALAACGLIVAADGLPQTRAAAAQITFNFLGQLYSGGTVTGQITSNPDGSGVTSFSFDLTQAGLPDALPANGILNGSTGYLNFAQGGSFQFEADVITSPLTAVTTILNLTFDAFPGPIHTGAGPLSSITQGAVYPGSRPDFVGAFRATSALTVATPAPEPGGFVLSAGAAAALAFMRRRKPR